MEFVDFTEEGPVTRFETKYQYERTDIIRGKNKLLPILNLIKDKAVICGGMARWMVSQDKDTPLPSDIDIYPFSNLIFNELEPQFNQKMFKVFESKGSVSYSQTAFNNPDNYSVQLIKPDVVKCDPNAESSFEKACSILDKFDYTVCKTAIGQFDGKLGAIKDSWFDKDEREKRLRIHHINCPIATLIRSRKYTLKGYRLSAFEIIKCLEHWRTITPEETRAKVAAWFDKEATEKMTFEELYEVITFID